MHKPYPILGFMAHLLVRDGQLIGKQAAVLHKYLDVAWRLNTTACVFDPIDVNMREHRMMAYMVLAHKEDGENELEWVEVPVPPVIYDQIATRRYENEPHVVLIREYLRTHATVFNDGFFDKWQVQSWLSTEKALAGFLPDTTLLDGSKTLTRFLYAHNTVFVKPIHGSLGIGIIKLVHEEGKILAILRTRTGHVKQRSFSHARAVYQFYRKRWLRNPHVLQEGLSLLTVDDRPVDIRVLLQKDRKGRWRKTKVYLRVAAIGEFTSNLTTGGLAIPLSTLVLIEQGLSLSRLERQIRLLATLIPVTLERASGRLLGELGIDLGVAQNGRLSIIEVNSKPWKAPETVHGSTQLVELSFLRPVRFAIHLARTVDARGETPS